jgi:tetratricopeptide (TPR) repeat protein
MILLAALAFAATHASAASPREELVTLTAQLQKAPSDEALRDKVITLAKKVKPAPAVPEAARRAFIRGTTAFKVAKNAEDFSRAVARYEEASLTAPWWSDAYFNLAKAQQAAQDYDGALRSLKRYTETASSKADIRQGQDMIYSIEELRDVKKAETDKASSVAASAQSAADAKARDERSIVGDWHQQLGPYQPQRLVVARKGESFEMTPFDGPVMNVTFQAGETTIKYSYDVLGDKRTYDLHRDGAFLVGTWRNERDGKYWENPVQFFRKP